MRRVRIALVFILGTFLASCISSEPVFEAAQGILLHFGRVNGTIVDVTGGMVAVESGAPRTILEVYVPEALRAGLAPGTSARFTGVSDGALLRADRVRLTGGKAWPEPAALPEDSDRIEHILFLIQENHSFDNYFGAFPGADGPPAGARVVGVAPFHFPNPWTGNMLHHWSTAHAVFNEGKMDGFITAEGSRDTMGFFDGSDIPAYWAYAAHFTLADRFFTSVMGPTLPNRLYSLAAQSGGVRDNKQSPPRGGFSFPALPERLSGAGVSWKCYIGGPYPQAFTELNPLPGFASFMKSRELMSNLVKDEQLFHDLRDGTLPSVAWIAPNAVESEHPPVDVRIGMWYVTSIVNALMKSPYWKNTVLIVAWDDYGGFYDHVRPPSVDDMGYGLRVPALIVSSRAKAGFVDHTTYDFTSVLKFMEERFQVAPLGSRDAAATSIGKSLDMGRLPLEPVLVTEPFEGTR